MNRRTFLKISGGFVALSACAPDFKSKSKNPSISFPVHVNSNRTIGHLVRSAHQQPITQRIETETLVVGGGIAGLSAALNLKNNDYLICELNPHFGGTSNALEIGSQLYAQGAHYDLAYPSYYGNEGLAFLERLNIIEYNSARQLWTFKDQEYLINPDNESACFFNNQKRESVLPNNQLRVDFYDLLAPYEGKMPLPTSQISKELHHLDHITFYDYLQKYLPLTPAFIQGIDYQMLDDYGGTSAQISALAGIHYYKCRPYNSTPEVPLFSPPQGNYYFIEKMLAQVPQSNQLNAHLVTQIAQNNGKWEAQVYDVKNRSKKLIAAHNVVYAGQKHTIKYIHPASAPLFNTNSYAPWLVVIFELKEEAPNNSKWQNDYLSANTSFLGFVDSKYQHSKGPRVLTAYFCFNEVNHYFLQNLEQDMTPLISETVGKLSTYFKVNMEPLIKQAHARILGHAMPIPTPGYLTKERSLYNENLNFAGVDTGRLPLMFDAMDSGIQAAKHI